MRTNASAKTGARLFMLASLVATLLFQTGCGIRETSSQTSAVAAPEPRVPVLVVYGGWASCRYTAFGGYTDPRGLGAYSHFLDYYERLKKAYGREPRFVVSCYTEFKQRQGGKARYYSTLNAREYQRGSPAEMVALVRRLTEDVPTDVYMIGHSMGGWLAMKTAANLPPNANLVVLATLDPISQVNCNPSLYLYSWFKSSYEGCREAPRDISVATRRLIRSRAGIWLNYFQQDFYWIMSYNIPAAHENKLLRYKVTNRDAHRGVFTDPIIWTRLRSLIKTPAAPVARVAGR